MWIELFGRQSRRWALHLGRSVLVLAILAVTSSLALPFALVAAPGADQDAIGAAAPTALTAESEDATPDVPEERDDDERDDEDPELADAVLASDLGLDRARTWAASPRAARAARTLARGARGGHARTIERPPHA
jgi:hypothetical protein